ncbi:MAG: DUF6644 family protein [Acidobacteriota bacterium]
MLATHLACIGVFGAMILITNLRLMGWALKDVPLSDIVGRLRPWKHIGFTTMVTCGILLAGSKAQYYLGNPFFLVKMCVLLVIGLHGLTFRKAVYQNTAVLDRSPVMPSVAKFAGVSSLILWITIASLGRWIAYWDDPTPPPQAPVTDTGQFLVR